MLLIVSDKVLDGSTDALALETVDVGGSNLTGQSGIFGEGFESSSTERRSLNVDGGGQEADGVSGLGFVGKESTGIFGKRLGESGSDTGRIGKGRGGG